VYHIFVGASVVDLWQAWIDLMLAIGIPESFLASLAQLLLEEDSIPGIAFVHRVCDIANKGHQTDEEVNG
jgi:hypothetical protein